MIKLNITNIATDIMCFRIYTNQETFFCGSPAKIHNLNPVMRKSQAKTNWETILKPLACPPDTNNEKTKLNKKPLVCPLQKRQDQERQWKARDWTDSTPVQRVNPCQGRKIAQITIKDNIGKSDEIWIWPKDQLILLYWS